MRFLSLILILGFLILVFANEITRIQTANFNEIDHDQVHDQVERKLQDQQHHNPVATPGQPGHSSAPQDIYANPNSGNKCLVGVPSDPTRPLRVNPQCA